MFYKTLGWSVLVLVLLLLYVLIYCNLGQNLQTVFDEGFYFLDFKSDDVYTVSTRPLSLSGELMKAVFPDVVSMDVLALRRLAYCMKGLGIGFLLLGAFVFLYKKKQEESLASYLSLSACVLLLGLFVMPSVVVNSNDVTLFLEMIMLALSLVAISVNRAWSRGLCVGLIGCFSFFAMLCNAPAGVMQLFLCFLFLSFYKGFDKLKLIRDMAGLLLGAILGFVLTHFFVVRMGDVIVFVQEALGQTTNGSSASHHSLTKLAILVLLNLRDLVMTLVMLCGITYLCGLIHHAMGKKWLSIVVGVALFVVMYKWQVKPEIKIASIVTWLVLMSLVIMRDAQLNARILDDNVILILFLYLMPMAISVGSNLGFMNKATTFIVPWGILLYFLSNLTERVNRLFSNGLLIFVFSLVLFGHFRGMLSRQHDDKVSFTNEYPIARMQLDENQFGFYKEVYDILNDYGYKSRQDTILGFCFNEMTIVAMDAVPYTNDQLPEEFLLHDKDVLVKPTFMILSEWDVEVLKPVFETLDWGSAEEYDVYKLKNNPDPNSGYSMTQSTLYCLKNRRIVSSNHLR